MSFFEATNPSVPRCGAPGVADNQAEWIVDLTTKVGSALGAPRTRPHACHFAVSLQYRSKGCMSSLSTRVSD